MIEAVLVVLVVVLAVVAWAGARRARGNAEAWADELRRIREHSGWVDCPACGQLVIPSHNGWMRHLPWCDEARDRRRAE